MKAPLLLTTEVMKNTMKKSVLFIPFEVLYVIVHLIRSAKGMTLIAMYSLIKNA